MRQVIVIHGGDFFDTPEEFLESLRAEEISKLDLVPDDEKSWKDNLAEDLGPDYEVLQPSMPSKDNAKYAEWKAWFEKVVPFMKDDAILVGHSLGGIFLERYIAENELPVKVGAVFLVAAPYFEKRSPAGFYSVPPGRLATLERVFIYHSEDDPVVSFDHAKRYADILPNASLVIFKDRGHFGQDHLPEIVKDIRSL
ncbi:MAG TPA: alpha/beta hydrolase [Candidatus Paceibacterota bacterium]|nr:alpha/beta hydrolase [Candidatus Paceibacterota bacterium]